MPRCNDPHEAGEVLAGLVERVTYHNAETGFCVLRAGRADIVML
jgi:exodeoxyribonuclease V alpha subunit